MQVWNKTFKNSQHRACQPGFCDSKALFFSQFLLQPPGLSELVAVRRLNHWTRWCKGCMPTQGNPQRQAFSGDRLPYLSKHHPEKLLFGPANTVKNPITSLTAFKDSSWLPGEKANSDVFASDHLHGTLLLSCLVINASTRAEALEFGSDHSLKSHGPAFQLKSKMSSAPEAASLTDSEQWHSECWLFMREWIIPLPRCHKCSKRSTLSEKPYFINPLPTTFHPGVQLQIYTLFITFFWNILAC